MVIFTAGFITGCISPFFNSTQGTCINAGVSLPADGNIDLQIMSYLSGEKIMVKEKSDISYQFNMCETNSYFFGMIKTEINRNGKIKVK